MHFVLLGIYFYEPAGQGLPKFETLSTGVHLATQEDEKGLFGPCLVSSDPGWGQVKKTQQLNC